MTYKLAVVFVTILAISFLPSVLSQSTQVSSTVTLQYLNVQLSYPSEVLPSQSVTVNVQATAKQSIRLVSLTLEAYYADGNSLRQLATTTIAEEQSMASGGQVSKAVQINVPGDTLRTSLIAVVNEKVRVSGYTYSYPYPYSYYAPYYYYANCTAAPYYCTYYYRYYALYPYPSYYASYVTSTDGAVAPLSYVKATTPEYATLQSEYQVLQQKLNQAQTENQKLQQDLQDQKNLLNQKDTTIADLNQQLAGMQGNISAVEIIAVVLGILSIFLAALVVFFWGKTSTKSREATAARQ